MKFQKVAWILLTVKGKSPNTDDRINYETWNKPKEKMIRKSWTLTGAADGGWLCAAEISGIFTVVAEFHSHGLLSRQVEANWYTAISRIMININLRDDAGDKRRETSTFFPRPISFSGPNSLKGPVEFLVMILLCIGSCFNWRVMASFPLDLVHKCKPSKATLNNPTKEQEMIHYLRT